MPPASSSSSSAPDYIKVHGVPGLYRHTRSGMYLGLKKVEGKRKERSLKTTDRKIAERRLKAWFDELGKVDTSVKKTTLEELFAKLPQVEAREKDGVAYAVLKSEHSKEVPEIDLDVGGKAFRLSKRATIYQQDDDGRPALSITGQNSFTDNTWIVGALFLQDFVTVFDWEHKRVGFVPTHEYH